MIFYEVKQCFLRREAHEGKPVQKSAKEKLKLVQGTCIENTTRKYITEILNKVSPRQITVIGLPKSATKFKDDS